MNLSEANLFVPVVAASCYTLLLIASFTRRSRQESQTRWLSAFLIFSTLWEFVLFLSPTIVYLPHLAVRSLLVGTTLLGTTTAVYVGWPHHRRWLFLGGILILATVALDLFLPNSIFYLSQLNLMPMTYGSALAYSSWLVLSSYILLRTWYAYRQTRFPWHANRLLYWVIALLFIFIGEGLLFWGWSGLSLAGQLLRLIGALALAYAVASHRLFDVRTRSQYVLTFTLITLISALPVVGAVLLVQELATDTSTAVLLTAVAIVLGFFFYQPFRGFVQRVVHRYFSGEGFDTNKVLRNYSHAISRTLDVQQLALVIIGTLSELLEINRGALMLLSRVEDGHEIEAIPGMGHLERRKVHFGPESPFIRTLAQQHQPLLQYEIDFNPDYAAVAREKPDWFKEMAMEAYVPISAGVGLEGLIAIGPKRSGVPYQPDELELVQTMADQTVVALQNARLYSELGAQNDKIRLLNVDLVNKNDRLEIMDRVKSDFITIASHELRTPLTQVKGYADILAAMNDESILTREQTREIVSHINRATLQLENLITAMLDASQIDVDGMQLTFVQTSLETIIRLAIEPLAHAMKERRIAFHTEGLKTIPPIHADFKRLVQSFTNIIGNAVKYTPDSGTITVEATLLTSEDNAEQYVEIVVADTGIGIDPKYHDLIFEKFFRIGDPQLHSTGSTKFKGAGPGLGLPIAKGVIEAHSGRIWVESEREDENRLPGSRFHIILPLQPPDLPTQLRLQPAIRSARPVSA